MGVTREEKETQRGHIFNIKFKLPIVNDSIEYKNKQNKSKGYSLKDGKKSIKTKELKVNDGNRWNHVYVEGISKKKGNNIGVHPNSFNGDGMNLDGTLFTSTIPFLEFSIQFQSNSFLKIEIKKIPIFWAKSISKLDFNDNIDDELLNRSIINNYKIIENP